MTEKSIILSFPFLPCSMNEAYAGFPRRHKSNKYKEFEKKMEIHMRKYPKFEIDGDRWLSVKYVFYFPLFFKNGNIRKRDLCNLEKTLSDCLAHHIPGFLDEKIKEIAMIKEDSEEERMDIIIYER